MDYKAKARELLAPWEQFHPRTFEEMVAKVADALQSQAEPTGVASTGEGEPPEHAEPGKLELRGEYQRGGWYDLCVLVWEDATGQRWEWIAKLKYEEGKLIIEPPVAAPVSDGPQGDAMLVMGNVYRCPACQMPLTGTPEGHLPNCVVREATETNLKNDGWLSPYPSEGVSDGRLEGARVTEILKQAQEKVKPIVEHEAQGENVGDLMDFRMKGMGPAETFEWLRQRSNRLDEAESVASFLRAQLEGAKASELGSLRVLNSMTGEMLKYKSQLEQAESSLRELSDELEQLKKRFRELGEYLELANNNTDFYKKQLETLEGKGEVKDGDIQGQQAKDPEASQEG